MADCYDKQTRHRVMQCIHSEDTVPEMRVRSILHRIGYRYRLHMKELPGKPDIVLVRLHTVILVNGCFWHQHPGCKQAKRPKTKKAFWNEKLERNIARDQENIDKLRRSGWRVLVIWECQVSRKRKMQQFMEEFLKGNGLLPMQRNTIFIQLRLFE